MIVRNCAGGIVFFEDKVLLICNDKQEWSFPKGVLKAGDKTKLSDLALRRVKLEAGVDSKVLAPCGRTNYEFYSISRRKPVHNNISWFVLAAETDVIVPGKDEGIEDAAFIRVEDALEKITYSQDRSLLMMAYQKYREIA